MSLKLQRKSYRRMLCSANKLEAIRSQCLVRHLRSFAAMYTDTVTAYRLEMTARAGRVRVTAPCLRKCLAFIASLMSHSPFGNDQRTYTDRLIPRSTLTDSWHTIDCVSTIRRMLSLSRGDRRIRVLVNQARKLVLLQNCYFDDTKH